MPHFSPTDLRLSRQNTALIVKWRGILASHCCVWRNGSDLVVKISETCHHRVHIESVRACAAEGRHLLLLELTMEECLGFLASLVLIVGWRALFVITDILFDHLLLLFIINHSVLVISMVALIRCLHTALHR